VQRSHLPTSIHDVRIALCRADPVGSEAQRAISDEAPRFLLYFPALAEAPCPDGLAVAFARESAKLWEAYDEYAYALHDRVSGAFVGHASVHALMWKHGCAELAYWVTSSAAGRGYASAAVDALTDMLFERGFHRVEIRCDVRNEASRKVAERCGFRLDGTLREHMRRGDGTFRCSHVFGRLAHERGERGS
jgi:ribosomal-protein-serine acetyltransferase